MSLVNCKECNKEVSDKAYKCPGCGATLKKIKRGIFGKLFLWIFILFNILMFIWLIVGGMGASEVVQTADSEAAQAGAAIGTALGVGMIIAIWALGDVILGLFVLFTKPKAK